MAAGRGWVRQLRFVVTGTGRSGTATIARMLTGAGIPCGHESWFTTRPCMRDRGVPDDRWRGGRRVPRPALPAMCQLNRIREELRRRRTGLVGDASWLAVPRLPRFGGRVYLQVRHPLAVVSRFVGRGFFTEASLGTSPFAHFAALHLPLTGDPVADAARWWVEWNHRALPYAHRW